MLKTRIITALILAPLALLLVFYADALWFALITWAITALAVDEWAGFLRRDSLITRVVYVATYALLAWLCWQIPEWHPSFLMAGCLLWAAAIVAVLVYPRGASLFRQPAVLALLGLMLPIIAWMALLTIRALPDGSLWIGWILLLVWAADIGAYFGGRAMGKRRLAPAVSPGKTWEGVAGGYLLAGLVCGGIVLWWQPQAWLWGLITLMLIAISVFGDLFESLIKRATGVKDSGTILPGHGGVLDRIDSVLAVLPVCGIILLSVKT